MKTYTTIIISILFISTCFAQQDLLPVFPREISFRTDKGILIKEHVIVSHILVRASDDDKADFKKINDIYNQLIKGADFATVAKEKSDDESKHQGGVLDLLVGEQVGEPSFEDACFNGKIGVIQKPFKTSYGYHIIKITDRTNRDVVGDIAYFNGLPFTGLLVDEKTKKRLGEFRNGYKNGMFLENYANGKKKSEGKYANGIPIDTHNFWSENGLTLNEKKYLNGIVIKEVIYENGQIIKTKDLLTEFYPNGQKKSEGFLISGNKEGFWTFWYEGGLKKSEGNYKEGNQSGQWVLWFEDGGKKFEGNYLNAKIDGQGIERSKSGITYNGSWKNDSREGYGTITLADGSMFFQGEFKDGEMNGQGIAYDHGKKIYEGEWKNGKRNGKGTYYEEDKEGSSQGTGNFVNNRFEGHGTFTKKFFSGAVTSVASFIGEFKNGNFYDGIFYVTYTDGDKIAVEYKNGIKGNAIKIK